MLIDTLQWWKPCVSIDVDAKSLPGKEHSVKSSDPSKASQGRRDCRADTSCITEGRTAFKLTYQIIETFPRAQVDRVPYRRPWKGASHIHEP